MTLPARGSATNWRFENLPCGVFDFCSICCMLVQLHQISEGMPHLFSEGMYLGIFVTAVWCPSMPAGRVPSCIICPFDDLETCRRLQDDRDFNWCIFHFFKVYSKSVFFTSVIFKEYFFQRCISEQFFLLFYLKIWERAGGSKMPEISTDVSSTNHEVDTISK